MSDDRRVQRTRARLQDTLLNLLQTRDYDSITIQDITDAANVGRSTFYLHYDSKDDLYRRAHLAAVGRISRPPLTRQEYLADDPPERVIEIFAFHWSSRDLLRMIYFGKDTEIIHRQLREHNAQRIAEQLGAAFGTASFVIPLDVLAQQLAIAEMGLMTWWIEKHAPYTPRQMAGYFHRLRRGMLRAGLAES